MIAVLAVSIIIIGRRGKPRYCNELILYVLYLFPAVVVVMANTLCTVSIGSDPFVDSSIIPHVDHGSDHPLVDTPVPPPPPYPRNI